MTINTLASELSEVEVLDFRDAKLPFEIPPIDDFDPAANREPAEEIKPWMAYFHRLYALGPGLLGIPMAISQTGIVLGPILVIVLGFLVGHMHLTLLWCLNEINRQKKIPYIPYRYGFRVALLHGPPFLHDIANHGPKIIASFMIANQLGICTILVLLTADNIKDVNYITASTIMDWSNIFPALAAIYVPFLLLVIFMTTLKIVSYVSIMGYISSTLGVILITISIFKDPHGYMKPSSTTIMSFYIGFGHIIYNLSSIGILLSCDKSLKNAKIMTSWWGVVTSGVTFSSVLACIFGSLGYWSFGAMEENILRALPYDETLTMVTFGVYLFSGSLSYPIQSYPAIHMLVGVIKFHDPKHPPADKPMKIVSYIIRLLFVTLSFIFAYYVPFQGAIVAFVGNLCTTLLSLVFPAVMEICLLYPYNFGRFKCMLIKDILISILGLTSWVAGVVLTANHLYILVRAIKSPNGSEFK